MSSIRTAIDGIKVLRQANVPLMEWGPPGVGKSDSFIQAAMEISDEEFNTDYNGDVEQYKRDVRERLSTRKYDDMFLVDVIEVPNIDPTDLMGIPFVVKENGYHITTWARPDFIRSKGNGLLVFDEVTNGDSLTVQSLRNIVLKRQVKNHYLGEGWFPSLAGNRTEDKSFSRAIPAPLITRLCHIGVACDLPNFENETVKNANPDIEEWIAWAMKNNVRSEVIGYIQDRPSQLYKHQAVPRTWKFVSDVIHVLEKKRKITFNNKGTLTDNVSICLLSGLVSAQTAHEFGAYLRLKNEIPDIENILKNPLTAPIPNAMNIQHILCVELIYAANNHETADNIMKYATREDGMDVETQSFLGKGLLDKNPSFLTCPKIMDWANKHPDIMIA